MQEGKNDNKAFRISTGLLTHRHVLIAITETKQDMFRNLTFLFLPLNLKNPAAELGTRVHFEFLKKWKNTVSFHMLMNVFSLVSDMLKPYT